MNKHCLNIYIYKYKCESVVVLVRASNLATLSCELAVPLAELFISVACHKETSNSSLLVCMIKVAVSSGMQASPALTKPKHGPLSWDRKQQTQSFSHSGVAASSPPKGCGDASLEGKKKTPKSIY